MMFYGPIANNYLCSKCFKENGGVAALKQPASKPADSEMKDETTKAAVVEE
jgi:hypothetical protein